MVIYYRKGKRSLARYKLNSAFPNFHVLQLTFLSYQQPVAVSKKNNNFKTDILSKQFVQEH
jgi:hypothetical protein